MLVDLLIQQRGVSDIKKKHEGGKKVKGRKERPDYERMDEEEGAKSRSVWIFKTVGALCPWASRGPYSSITG